MDDGSRGGELLEMAPGLPWSDITSFPADAASASEARHFVRHALHLAGVSESVIDNVELVVSELVTNSVLHAATGPTVTIALDRNCIRLEVRDASTRPPALAYYGASAATGRGLSVVSRAARGWGFDTDQFGKTVWAEFAIDDLADFDEDQPPQVSSEIIVDSRVRGNTKLVRFNSVPVDLYLELEQNNDATLREFELLAIQVDSDSEHVRNIHHRLAALFVRSNSYLTPAKGHLRSAVQRAKKRGLPFIDLKAHVDAESVTFAREFASLMEEADALSDRGVLLTASAPQAVRQLRYWFNEEIQQQYENGRPPIAFSLHS